jgi:hypothetical protein
MIFPSSNSRAIFMDIRCHPNILGNLSECVIGDNIICLYVWRSAIYHLPSAAGYNTLEVVSMQLCNTLRLCQELTPASQH